LHLIIRLFCFAVGFSLATSGPAMLTTPESGIQLFIYGMPAPTIMVLNGDYAYLGTFMTIVGLILIITAFYRQEEKFPIIKTWFETECW